MIKVDALQKYENALLENFSPAVLRELKRSNWSGLLREVDRLYATMYHEWDCLQKDVTDIEDAVRSLTWTVNPKVQDGAEPEPMAKEVAKCVEDALWRRAVSTPGSVGHSFSQLLGALCHARYRGFNVHQIVWENGGDLIFPARYIQLPPQFLVWETKAGHPDRLLLVPDGMSSDGVPFPPYQYLVALNTNGPDHPLYNATFYSLVNWFVAYKFGLGWFMEYAQKYGMPKQIIRYANERERQQIVADLSDESVLNTVLLKEGGGREFDMKYPTGGASSLPQAVLLQKAEEACHKAILGQTLTSDTSSNGGSLAQAKVHAGVQADVVMKVAEQVADVLNSQLVPAIVQANYGRIDGLPIPELRCKLPQAVANIERAQFLKTVMEVPGMEIKKSEAYEYLALSQPAEGDEVLKKEDPMAGGMPGILGGMMPPPGGGGDDGAPHPPAGAPVTKRAGIPAKTDEVTSARAAEGSKNADPAVAWLAPIKKKLAEARSSGASLAELKEQIRAWRPNTTALATAMAENIAAGFQGRANGNVDEISAENPYGCNQHAHSWVSPCPYDSGSGAGSGGTKDAMKKAGGAENVNPEPDTEEEKKKAAEEAAKKAEYELHEYVENAIEEYSKSIEEGFKGVREFSEYERALELKAELRRALREMKDWVQKLKSADTSERDAALREADAMADKLKKETLKGKIQKSIDSLQKVGFQKYMEPQLEKARELKEKYKRIVDEAKAQGGKFSIVQKNALSYIEETIKNLESDTQKNLEQDLEYAVEYGWESLNYPAKKFLKKINNSLDKRASKIFVTLESTTAAKKAVEFGFKPNVAASLVATAGLENAEKIIKAIETAPDYIKGAIKSTASGLSSFKKNEETSCYNPSKNNIEFDFHRVDEKYPGGNVDTALHETGHAVDYRAEGGLYSLRPEFKKAYEADIDAIAKRNPKAKLNRSYNPFPEIKKSNLQRIYGDALRWAGYKTYWGHDWPDYYEKRGGEDSARKETWATLFAVCASGDQEKIETAKKVLPNMYACVIRQLKGEIL